jgi:hypothetical protein
VLDLVCWSKETTSFFSAPWLTYFRLRGKIVNGQFTFQLKMTLIISTSNYFGDQVRVYQA